MKKIIFLIFFCILISIQVFSNESYNRIVSLKPNITSTLIEIGAKEQIVGITKYCTWPDSKTPLKVADYLGPKTEAVVSLKPDLILSSEENSLKAPIYNLEKAGLNVKLFPFDNLKDISSSILEIGKLTGHEDKASIISKNIDKIKNKKQKEIQKTAIIIIGTKPFVVAGYNTYLNELLSSSSFKNIAPDRGKYPRIGTEELMILKPEVVIDLTPTSIPKELIPASSCYKKLTDNDFQPGPQIIEAAKQLEKVYKECSEKK